MPHRSEFPSRDDVFQHLRALVAGHGDRDAIATWAERQMRSADDREVTDWPAWHALQALIHADAPTTDRDWLYDQEDFEAWLAQFISAVLQDREELLRRAGLVPLGTVDEVAGVTPAVAWERLLHDGEIVDIAVDQAWLRERGLFGADDEFLVSTERELPWARVRLGEWPGLLEARAFVVMSADGGVVCGVVPEDYGVTIRFAAGS